MHKFIKLISLYLILIHFPLIAEDTVIVGYFAEWGIYGRNHHIMDIPGDKLTHVNYAFAQISPQGEVLPFDSFAAIEKSYPGDQWDESVRGNFKQLQILKRNTPSQNFNCDRRLDIIRSIYGHRTYTRIPFKICKIRCPIYASIWI